MIYVLRLGHRKIRDARLSTHCGLVARAFGADGIIYSGEEDQGLLTSMEKARENWGGRFEIRYDKNFKSVIAEFRKKKFFIIHLTMFGISIPEKLREIRSHKRILFVIGSEKVPGEMYHMADLNVAVGNQPHSEAAALAVALHEYFEGKELERKFHCGKIKVIPQEKGKRTCKSDGSQ